MAEGGDLRALVVFFDPETPCFAWLLKPGFRHVFACIDDGNHWIMLDGRDGKSVIQVIQSSDYDLKGFFEAEGYRVIEVDQGGPLRTPLVTTSCVGLVKAVLCIKSFALTPFQLYKHLGGNLETTRIQREPAQATQAGPAAGTQRSGP